MELPGIELLGTPAVNPLTTITPGLTKIPPLASDPDNTFTLTFNTGDLTTDVADANAVRQTALTAIADNIAEDDSTIGNAVEAADGVLERADETATDVYDALVVIRNAVTTVTGADVESTVTGVPVTRSGDDYVATDTGTAANPDTPANGFVSPAKYLENIQKAIEDSIDPKSTTFALDIFTFGADANNAIYRALLEETDSASGVFEATIEYQVLNQRTHNVTDTHDDITAISNELAMILDTGYTGGDAPEFTYDEDNASKDAPTNTGEVNVDASTYRVSDDVTITLVDADLNTDSGAREIYKIANINGTMDPPLVSIAIGDSECADELKDVSLRETANDSGIFEGSFEIPAECNGDMTTGESITVTYTDFRDETGGDSEWTDTATIGADTGSVSLDRTVFPVPTAADADNNIEATQVTISVAVDDSDVDTSSSSTQTIETERVTLTVAGLIVDLDDLKESEPDSGIFEASIAIGYMVTGIDADGEQDTLRIEQGDIITVKYTDESDASGNQNSVSDSATFDLRNAVLQSDKSVYVIGQDALLTLIEADLNLDSGTIDNVDLDRINWDSEAYDDSLDNAVRADLGPVPTNLRETGENTGIFQVVITISDSILGEAH